MSRGAVKAVLSGVLSMLVSILPAGDSAAADLPSASRIVQLARVLSDSPLPVRSDFAWLAVSEMAGIYSEEATRARQESSHTARALDLSQWAAAVDRYAGKMTDLAGRIAATTAIDIHVGPDNSVIIYIDSEPVIVTGAISGQQALYEQRVLKQFCVLYLCDSLLADSGVVPLQVVAPVTGATHTGAHWSFSQYAGPVCMTDNGLEFQFQDMADIRRKRESCNRTVTELNELAGAMATELSNGIAIDWNALVITVSPLEAHHRVRLSSRHELRMSLPVLAGSPDLFRLVRPWLAARAQGEGYRLVILNAGQLMN